MIYKFFAFTMFFSFGYAALSGGMGECVSATLGGVGSAVTLTLTLAGMMCFWNGAVSIIKSSRLLAILSRVISPTVGFLFPSSRKDNEMKKELSLFMCANMLGLGNAATPVALGIMKRLDDGSERVNDDTVMLNLVSTAPITLIPTTVMTVLEQSGSTLGAVILPYAWLCSFLSFIFAISVGKVYISLRRKE